MKKNIIIISLFFLIACNQESERITNSIKTDTDQIENNNPKIQDASKTPEKNLKKYYYPDLTVWGGLTLSFDEKELKKIEARQNAELGYIEKVFYLNKGKFINIDFRSHSANWEGYFNKYGKDIEIEDSNMIYTDHFISYDSTDLKLNSTKELEDLIQEGEQILDFIETENIDSTNI